ncbi:MAG: WecB/TagA/CpsF family glycosyltransferase [Candidatus Omnitrophica bacterium]|jgi:N-acetylglucosaminyldiphosphoundecaprenol N-acetyl-beta-D-mannosaminyltransferase|nr:WecB/TagA/CpsF family glycosyltransferase [Candidatus Omnitrophota bacterium]
MRKYIFHIPVDCYGLGEIRDMVISGKKRVFNIFLNIRKINLLYGNKDFSTILSDDECVFSIDGKWVEWLARICGIRTGRCFGGLHVIDSFFSASRDKKLGIYLLGAQEAALKGAVSVLTQRFPASFIAGSHNGFFKDKSLIIEDIRKSGAEVLFIALPSPQKELLGYEIYKKVPGLRYAAGVGGAFNILSGKTTRAPLLMQTAGLEWFYRCLQEPAAMFKRYYQDGIGFLKIALKEMSGFTNRRRGHA